MRLGRAISILGLLLFAVSAHADLADEIAKARNPYAVLGLTESATQKEINSAFRSRAAAFKAAAEGGDTRANAALQKINAARAHLKPALENSVRRPWSYPDGSTDPEPRRTQSQPAQNSAAQAEARARASATAKKTQGTEQSQRSSRSGAQSGEKPDLSGRTGEAKADFAAFREKLAGAGPQKRDVLRTIQLSKVETPADFMDIVKYGANPRDPEWHKEVHNFATKNMDVFLETNPTAEDLKTLGQIVSKDANAAKDLRAAALLKATPQQKARLLATGPSASAASANAAKAATASSAKPGLFRRMAGKIFGRAFAVDPTLITGIARGLVEEGELESLTAKTCPAAASYTPRLLSKGYLQMLVRVPLADQKKIIKDCEIKSAEAGQFLKQAIGKTLDANRDLLEIDQAEVQCEAGVIRFKSRKGLFGEIQFSAGGEVESIDLRPAPPGGNVNHWLTYRAKAKDGEKVSYSSFAYPKNKKIEGAAKIRENESSFFLRLVCLQEVCDSEEFKNSQGLQSDENLFSLRPAAEQVFPSSRQPFGEMETDFLEQAGYDLHRLLAFSESFADQKPLLDRKLCNILRGEEKLTDVKDPRKKAGRLEEARNQKTDRLPQPAAPDEAGGLDGTVD